MTLEEIKEAVEVIKAYRQMLTDSASNQLDGDIEAFDMAVEAMEREQKTGHWRHYEGMLICSECRAEFYDGIMEYCGGDVPKCCPDCGARMVEPQERSGEE